MVPQDDDVDMGMCYGKLRELLKGGVLPEPYEWREIGPGFAADYRRRMKWSDAHIKFEIYDPRYGKYILDPMTGQDFHNATLDQGGAAAPLR
eukprot:gene35028-58002_t